MAEGGDVGELVESEAARVVGVDVGEDAVDAIKAFGGIAGGL